MEGMSRAKEIGIDVKVESVAESVGLQLKRIDALEAEDNAKILGHHGEVFAD